MQKWRPGTAVQQFKLILDGFLNYRPGAKFRRPVCHYEDPSVFPSPLLLLLLLHIAFIPQRPLPGQGGRVILAALKTDKSQLESSYQRNLTNFCSKLAKACSELNSLWVGVLLVASGPCYPGPLGTLAPDVKRIRLHIFPAKKSRAPFSDPDLL